MQDFIRVAYSGDHEQVERPYRVAMGAKAALWGGITLIALGLLIAAWQLFITGPEPGRAQTGAKTATTRAQSLGTGVAAAWELAWLVQLALPVQAGLLVEEIRLARGK